ncbi:MAG: UDP-N-acetylglucosamine diphosphorylase/glucosamine-phosphate N-acetyltransferase GlmU [Candidatus Parcubacteria bacterium]|jgi:bifunctional UDP-N-acetylglucosamine pyrophosphorylase/glucosamine-1-phosphate N-acetyltransferase
MQALFLLAGNNTRFYPLNTGAHKAMTMLYGKPLVAYAVESFMKCGIRDFVFVVKGNTEELRTYFQNWDITAQFAVQPEAAGQGDAILCAKQYIHESFVVTNPYHIDEESEIQGIMKLFQETDADGIIPGKYEERIHEYGALILENNQIKGIIEKPKPGEEPSHYKATSSYVFKTTFLSYLENDKSGHYSYESAISRYASEHRILMYEIPKDHAAASLKYPWQLLKIKNIIARNTKGYVNPHASVASTAVISPEAYIDDGARIMDGAHIIGHSYIGKDALVGNHAVVRDSSIEARVQVGVHSDIARSIIMEGTHSHGGGFIGDSVIGRDCRLAYGFTVANKRLDREEIFGYIADKKIATGTNTLGVCLGNGVKTGIHVSLMPGVLVGAGAVLMSGVIAYHNVPEKMMVTYKQEQIHKQL